MVTYTIDSKVGSLLDNPLINAVRDKHIPEFTSVALTLVSRYSGGTITAEKLAANNAELAKL